MAEQSYSSGVDNPALRLCPSEDGRELRGDCFGRGRSRVGGGARTAGYSELVGDIMPVMREAPLPSMTVWDSSAPVPRSKLPRKPPRSRS